MNQSIDLWQGSTKNDQDQLFPFSADKVESTLRKVKTLTNLVSTDGGRQDLEGLGDLGMKDEVGDESLRHGNGIERETIE